MSIGNSFFPEFDHEMARTRSALERCPAGQFDWQPHTKSMTLGRLAMHLTDPPHWLTMTLTTDELDFGAMPPPSYTTPASVDVVLQQFDERLAIAREALMNATDENLLGTWTARTGDKVHFAMPRVALVRGFVLNHMIHHRGQLSVYLRLLGVPVPALYGPSADEGGM